MEVMVKGCLSCPLKEELSDDDVWCNGTKGKRSIRLSVFDDIKPSWCPLRAGGVLVLLEEGYE